MKNLLRRFFFKRKIEVKNPSSPSIAAVPEKTLLELAKKALKHGEISTQEKLLEEHISLFGKENTSISIWVQLIVSKRKQVKFDEVYTLVDELLEAYPYDAAILREKAKNIYRDNQQQSLPFWRKAYETDPNYLPAALLYAKLSLQYGDKENFVTISDQLKQKYPDNKKVELLDFERLIIQERFDEFEENYFKNKMDNLDILGKYAVHAVRSAQQEIDHEGNRKSINLKERADFLINPNDQLLSWKKSKSAEKLKSNPDKLYFPIKKRDSEKDLSNNILFISDGNWNFMKGLTEHFYDLKNIEIRTLELTDIDPKHRPSYNNLIGRLIRKKPLDFDKNSNDYHIELIEWADTIFVEWGNYSAIWASWFIPSHKNLVIRIHSYEAFTYFPHFINWININTLITVADHIQNFLDQQLDFSQFKTNLINLNNYNDLKKYKVQKTGYQHYTLAMIGYNNANKNPIMALDILSLIRNSNQKFKLLLIGHEFENSTPNSFERNYRDRFFLRLKNLNLEQCVEFIPFNYNLEEEMPKIGHILSLSDREGTHESIIQSMASGAIPTIRKWPIVKKWLRSEFAYDKDWLFDTKEEAAAMIINHKNNFETLSSKAQIEAFEKFDKSVVMVDYEKILLKVT